MERWTSQCHSRAWLSVYLALLPFSALGFCVYLGAAGTFIRHIVTLLRAVSSFWGHQETVLSLAVPPGHPAFPGRSLFFQMCSDHHEGSWTLGQLTTSSTFSRRSVLQLVFSVLAVGCQGRIFSVRGWLSVAVLSLSPSVSWLHILVHFLSNLNAELCLYAGKISPCQFQLSFPPAVKLPCYPGSFMQRNPSDSQVILSPGPSEHVDPF